MLFTSRNWSLCSVACRCLQLAFSVVALLALSRVIEPVYGSTEYLKFLAIVNTAAVSSTSMHVQSWSTGLRSAKNSQP